MCSTTSSPASGYYHAKGDPAGTVRFWDGSQWQGGPTAPPTTEKRPERLPNNLRLASPGRRIGARALDYLIWVAIAILVALVLGVDEGASLQADVGMNASFQQNLVWFVAVATLEIGMVVTQGASLGKLALDLTVTDGEGNLPSIQQAALRVAPLALVMLGDVGSWFVIVIAFISLVLMFVDAHHHTLWDKIAKTVVIDRPV